MARITVEDCLEKIPNRFNHCMTNFQHRMLTSRAQPQVPVVHQKLRAVLFWRDRIIVDLLQHFSIAYIDFKATGRTAVSAYGTFNH